MKSKQVLFFSGLQDMDSILMEIEEMFDVRYHKAGLFDEPAILGYDSIFQCPNLGYTQFGDWNLADSYLVIPKSIQLRIREIPQRKGGIKYAVDQMINEVSIELKIGGIFTKKDNVLVAGRVASGYECEFSTSLLKLFSSRIKKRFRRVGSFFVGNDAYQKLNSGWRLVQSEGFSTDFDLRE